MVALTSADLPQAEHLCTSRWGKGKANSGLLIIRLCLLNSGKTASPASLSLHLIWQTEPIPGEEDRCYQDWLKLIFIYPHRTRVETYLPDDQEVSVGFLKKKNKTLFLENWGCHECGPAVSIQLPLILHGPSDAATPLLSIPHFTSSRVGYFAFYTPGALVILIQQYHLSWFHWDICSLAYLSFPDCMFFKSKDWLHCFASSKPRFIPHTKNAKEMFK